MIAEILALLAAPPGTAATFFLILSAPIFGSFLGVVATRLPEERSVVTGRSACDSCGTPLGVVELVPIASFIALRGRCRTCGAPIPADLPLIEALALLGAVWTLLVQGSTAPLGTVIATLGLGYTLLALSAIDVRHLILPDALTLPLIIAGLVVTGLIAPDRLSEHGIGALVGFVALWGVGAIYRVLRGRDGIGLGDAKLLAAAGAWVGPWGLPSVLLIGSMAGLLAALVLRAAGRDVDGSTAIPFGPFLALGIWLTWLHGPVQFDGLTDLLL